MNVHSIGTTFAHLPMDWIIIGLFLVAFCLDALRSGVKRAAAAALAAPLALLIFEQSESTVFISSFVHPSDASIMQAGIFAALFVGLFFLISKMLAVGFSSGAFPLAAILSGIAATALIVLVWLQIPALIALWPFSPWIRSIFGEAYRSWWIIGAYLLLAFSSL